MTPAAMKLKAALRNAAANTGIPAQLLLQDFFLERLLARFCISDVRANFVFKGGILLMGLLGVNRRTTMDLDATLRNAPLTEETVSRLAKRVCAMDAGERIGDVSQRLEDFRRSVPLKKEWERYRSRFPYASGIGFDDVLDSLRAAIDLLGKQG